MEIKCPKCDDKYHLYTETICHDTNFYITCRRCGYISPKQYDTEKECIHMELGVPLEELDWLDSVVKKER